MSVSLHQNMPPLGVKLYFFTVYMMLDGRKYKPAHSPTSLFCASSGGYNENVRLHRLV